MEYIKSLERRLEQLETKELHRFSKVGIGMVPVYPLDILGSGINIANVSGDNVDKVGRLITPAYDIDEEPVVSILGYHRSGINEVRVGGGSGLFNASTLISFYTAANAATLTGTERLRITSDGKVYSLDFTDYSGIVSYTGWSSFTKQMVYVIQIGKLTWVLFDINGTSNSTTTEVNGIPVAVNIATMFWSVVHRNVDNGVGGTGELVLDPNDDRLSWRKTVGGAVTSWTASGTKRVIGEVFYVAA